MFAVLAASGLAVAARAADAPPSSAPLSPNDPTRALPAPPTASAPLDVTSIPAPAARADATVRLVLQGVVFDGAKAVPETALRPAWADFVGKPVSLSDLRAIGHRAETLYAQAGYPFVAVVLRVQQVTGGVVHYDVVEGHISDLTVLGSNKTARRQATASLSPLVNRAPLSLADVETAYEEAKAVPGLAVSGTLRRGSEPGGMDLVVDAQRTEWRTYANVNDLYASPVGPWGILAGADYLGASVFGDQTSLQIYSSIPFGRQVLVRGSHSRRLNAIGTTVTFSGLWGQANPKGDLADLAIAQNVVSLRADIAQPVIARPQQSLQLDLALEGSNQKTDVFSNIALSTDKLRDLSFSVTGEDRGGFGRIAFTGEIHQNIDIFDASHAGDGHLSRPSADPEATILRGGAELETATYAHIVRLDARLDTQYSSKPLTIPDQYSVGNLTVGRGYQPGQALGDSAVAVSTEVRFGPFDTHFHKIQAEPFVFYDLVDLWDHGFALGQAPFAHRELNSVGGGVRFQINGAAHLDLMCAAPLDPPTGLGERTPAPSFLMNLTVSLDDAFSAIHRRLVSGSAK